MVPLFNILGILAVLEVGGGYAGYIWGIKCTGVHCTVKFRLLYDREVCLEVKSRTISPGSIQATPTILPASERLKIVFWYDAISLTPDYRG